MKLYCPKCNLVYNTVMGDIECPACGTVMEKSPRANRIYKSEIMTLGDKNVKK